MEIYDKSELTPALVRELVDLFWSIWPAGDPQLTREGLRSQYAKNRSPVFNHVLIVREKERVIGHTEIFSRPIFWAEEELHNLALAGVCVRPEFRGRRLGTEMVKRAFGYVDAGKYDCSVFQTQVPAFYEKLGAAQIGHTFINGRNDEDPQVRPWWDPHVMIYPAGFKGGEGIIDLNGEGY